MKEVDEESENEEMEESKEEQIEQPKSNTLNIRDVDAHWVKRKLEGTIEDKDIIKYE